MSSEVASAPVASVRIGSSKPAQAPLLVPCLCLNAGRLVTAEARMRSMRQRTERRWSSARAAIESTPQPVPAACVIVQEPLAAAGAGGAQPAASGASSHPLACPWTYWELRKQDKRQGLADWGDLPLPLFTFQTVEDFYKYWLRTPHITLVRRGGAWELRDDAGDVIEQSPARRSNTSAALVPDLFPASRACSDVFDPGTGEANKIERDDERCVHQPAHPYWTTGRALSASQLPRSLPTRLCRRPGGVPRKLLTTAEAYMLFRRNIKPATEYELPGGKGRATLNRRRAELAVRPKEFETCVVGVGRAGGARFLWALGRWRATAVRSRRGASAAAGPLPACFALNVPLTLQLVEGLGAGGAADDRRGGEGLVDRGGDLRLATRGQEPI
jgi:hypothetical protein